MAKKEAKAKSSIADHRDKRRIVSANSSTLSTADRTQINALGLNLQPRSMDEFIASQPGNTSSSSFSSPRIVYRTRIDAKRGATLVDTRSGPQDVAADEEAGFYVVQPDESVFFLDAGPCVLLSSIPTETDDVLDHKLELAVLRGILLDTPFTDDLYSWLEAVVLTACNERRDVRVREHNLLWIFSFF